MNEHQHPGRPQFKKRVKKLFRSVKAASLGRIGTPRDLVGQTILHILENNNNRDPILRHGGIMALVYLTLNGDRDTIEFATTAASESNRLAVVVALRKLHSLGHGDNELLGKLVRDENPAIALEAARAI